VSVIVLGRYPQWLYDFNSGVVRYIVRFCGWADLQTDDYPPIGLEAAVASGAQQTLPGPPQPPAAPQPPIPPPAPGE